MTIFSFQNIFIFSFYYLFYLWIYYHFTITLPFFYSFIYRNPLPGAPTLRVLI